MTSEIGAWPIVPSCYNGRMLIRVDGHYFAWEFDRIDGVVAALALGQPFTAYPGSTRVVSDGASSQVSLDGRSVHLPNVALADALRQAKEQHAEAGFSGGSPSP